ncbi:MAG: 50S ribosomal protein L5 [Elusimicrobia bacterium]|nr:50S ribosomal protein L5 [Elusimicrobiota bacterium]
MAKKIKSDLYKRYIKDVMPKLQKETATGNMHDVPQLKKIIVNMGLKKAKDDKTVLEEAKKDMAKITGLKPVVTKAKKSISNFDLKEKDPIGCCVTLRGSKMYDFMEKLLRVVFPRIRDFDGLKRGFDRYGNLTIGLKDESVFPEIDADNIKHIKGIGITIVTDKLDRELSEKMLVMMGFPFKENRSSNGKKSA